MPDLAPIRILDIELSEPLPELDSLDRATNHRYMRGLCLVRLHTHLLGLVELFFTKERLQPEDYAGLIWGVLSSHINKHLLEDRLAPLAMLDVAGVPSVCMPLCIEERERFLEHAPFVSVIVLTRNHPEIVQRCLHSLLCLRYPLYEIIVVDHASEHNAIAELIKHSYRNKNIPVRYVRESRPGIAYARNRGLYAARGSVLAYIDDDVLADPYMLAEQVRAFNVREKVACVTGQLLSMELEPPRQFRSEEYSGYSKGLAPQVFDLEMLRQASRSLYSYKTASFGTGACMAFRTAYLRSAKGFDTLLEHGSDIEAFFRVVARGYQLVYEPAALVRRPWYQEHGSIKKRVCNSGTRMSAFLSEERASVQPIYRV